MNEKTIQKFLFNTMTLLLFGSMILLSKQLAQALSNTAVQNKPFTVVIDSGHGGMDPGKIAADGTLEKDINLSIAKKLKSYLEASDIQVVMTRSSDEGLYKDTDTNKKAQDFKNRVALIEKSQADLVISIHQNSYPDSSVKGAQVFYYTTSSSGKQIAEILQSILVSTLDPTNHRKAKSNDSYYLLRKTTLPIVIVECGFLSCPEEVTLLTSEIYQDQIAWAIHMGILTYLNDNPTHSSEP